MTSRGRKIVGVVVAALVVAAATAGIVWMRYAATGEEMAEVTAPAVEVELPVEEIRAKLKSGNFRDKLAAKKQIRKLAPADRLTVLGKLLEDDDVATRLLAVSALAELGSNEARAKLAAVAEGDADEKVRAAAAEALSPPATAEDPPAAADDPPAEAAEPAAAAEPGEPAPEGAAAAPGSGEATE